MRHGQDVRDIEFDDKTLVSEAASWVYWAWACLGAEHRGDAVAAANLCAPVLQRPPSSSRPCRLFKRRRSSSFHCFTWWIPGPRKI